jgi:hypothetical protein
MLQALQGGLSAAQLIADAPPYQNPIEGDIRHFWSPDRGLYLLENWSKRDA